MEESTFFVQNMTVSPIGGIRIACFVKNGAGVLTSRRVLPHFTLVYVIAGKGNYRDENGVRSEVHPGDAIIVMPGVEHWYGPPAGQTWDELYLVFEGPVFDLWRERGCIDVEQPVIPLSQTEYWLDRIKRAIGESNEGDPVKMMAEAMRMQELLSDIQNASRTNIETELLWFEAAKLALMREQNVQSAASSLDMAYEVFRKKFRKMAGIPPGKYRTGLIMERACEILAGSSTPLKHVAVELGFCDEYHFSKQFSKTIGWSPSEYRARIVAK